MGAGNAIRHRHQGYVRPRPFSADDLDRTIRHATEIVDRLQERGGIDWHGQRVLEIGPGSDLSTGAIMLDRGAAGYLAVDLFDNRAQAHPDLYRRLGEVLDREVREDELGFTLASFPDLPELEGEYDLIVSNATLEHVQNVGYLFRRLRGLASTRARMVHHIDAQTHMRWIKDTDPLNILRFPDVIYRNLLDFPGAPNRLRARDFERLAGMAGWASTRVVRGRRAPAGYVSRTRVNRRFRAYDLDALTFTLLAER